jgi:hypothetical protein
LLILFVGRFLGRRGDGSLYEQNVLHCISP